MNTVNGLSSPVPVGPTRPGPRDIGLWLILLCFLMLTLPALLGVAKAGRDYDEVTYHFPTVQEIVRTWPRIEMNSACFSAVSPGYHYVLATAGRLIGDKLSTLRWINWAFALALPVVGYFQFRTRLPLWRACLLLLPLTACNFFVKSAAWILPDNAGVAAVAFTLMGLMRLRGDETPGWQPGVWAALATAFRQLNLWLAGALTARCGWWFCVVNRSLPTRLSVRQRIVILAPALICGVMLPMLLVGALYLAWGGLVPAQWRSQSVSAGFSLASWTYILSLFGVFGPFYLVGRPLAELGDLCRRPAAWSAVLLAVMISLLTPTAPNMEAGRWGGYLWEMARRLPILHERTVLFVCLAPLGAGVIVVFVTRLSRERNLATALTWLVSLVAWLSSMMANRQIFQRYYEPTVLVFLTIGASFFQFSATVPGTRLSGNVALLALTTFQIMVTVVTLYVV